MSANELLDLLGVKKGIKKQICMWVKLMLYWFVRLVSCCNAKEKTCLCRIYCDLTIDLVSN